MIKFKSLEEKEQKHNLSKAPVMSISIPDATATKKYYTITLNKVLTDLLGYIPSEITANTRIIIESSDIGGLFLINSKDADKVGMNTENLKKQPIISKSFTINDKNKSKKILSHFGLKLEELTQEQLFVGYKVVGTEYTFPVVRLTLTSKDYLAKLEAENTVYEIAANIVETKEAVLFDQTNIKDIAIDSISL